MYTGLARRTETRNNLLREYTFQSEEELRIGISQQIVITMGNEIRALSDELTDSIWKGMISKYGKR